MFRKRKLVPLLFGHFDPASLNAQLWLETSDISTLYQDSAHTTPVASPNDPVGAIFNKGSVADYFVQATAGKRPLYQPYGIHGVGIKFDGVDDVLAGSNASSYITTTVGDIMVAGSVTTITTNETTSYDINDSFFCDGIGASGGYIQLSLTSSSPTMHALNYSGGSHPQNVNYDQAANTPFVALWRHTGGRLYLSVNNSPLGAGVASAATISLAHALGFGADWTPTVYTEMEFMGAIARKTIFDEAELRKMWTYMGDKVGLSL